jgi:hypothetical protein
MGPANGERDLDQVASTLLSPPPMTVAPLSQEEASMGRHFVGALVLFAIVAAGCGGSSGGGTACTTGSGTSQSCFEIYASTATPDSIAQAKMDCTSGGGIASDTCPRAGADGACKMTDAQGGISVSITTWYYAGDAAGEMQSCASGGGTWIAP